MIKVAKRNGKAPEKLREQEAVDRVGTLATAGGIAGQRWEKAAQGVEDSPSLEMSNIEPDKARKNVPRLTWTRTV